MNMTYSFRLCQLDYANKVRKTTDSSRLANYEGIKTT